MPDPVYCQECAVQVWRVKDVERLVCQGCWNRGRRGPDVRLAESERPTHRVFGFGGYEADDGG